MLSRSGTERLEVRDGTCGDCLHNDLFWCMIALDCTDATRADEDGF